MTQLKLKEKPTYVRDWRAMVNGLAARRDFERVREIEALKKTIKELRRELAIERRRP